ncbi:MAG: ATP-binding cassette domain-containing protein [Methanolobus sp.]|uniref:ATP-binding cassette domain-containing protein n=1 Tax=Methanolobus sp. TaxID=1874737 RepID=UPI002731FD11|nr:ATP-binding cassette domain-containing protein [Methanolobus sp.]MDP2216610.1 ATP-binding cassette domain-containing protein [Methanolobus sp.]
MSIDVRNLTFRYDRGTSLEKTSLEDVSLSIDKGEFVLIGGEIGSGKSTLVRHFNGLLKPFSGQVTVDGMAAHEKKVKARVGVLFQFPQQQLFGRTVFEDVAFGPRNFGYRGNELDLQVHSALELLGLGKEIYSVSPFRLSGGQMRLVAIAGVLASRLDYIVLDEPFSGLDAENKKILLSALRHLNSRGTSVIVVSHRMSDLLSVADRVFLLDQGNLVFGGTPAEYVKHAPSHLPEITCLMKELRRKGFDVRGDIFNIDDAFSEISRVLNTKEAVRR